MLFWVLPGMALGALAFDSGLAEAIGRGLTELLGVDVAGVVAIVTVLSLLGPMFLGAR